MPIGYDCSIPVLPSTLLCVYVPACVHVSLCLLIYVCDILCMHAFMNKLHVLLMPLHATMTACSVCTLDTMLCMFHYVVISMSGFADYLIWLKVNLVGELRLHHTHSMSGCEGA